jgi:hypothetical protein
MLIDMYDLVYINWYRQSIYTISYIPIGIDKSFICFRIHQLVLTNRLYNFVYMKLYYSIPHTQYSPTSTLSCCCHSHYSGLASKDSPTDDGDYVDKSTSKEDDGDERNGDKDISNSSFASENEHVVLNLNYKQKNMLMNFSGLTSHLDFCYDPPLGPFSECYCIVHVMKSVNTTSFIQICINKFTYTISYMPS